MNNYNQDDVARLAYEIWVQDGRPDGAQQDTFWKGMTVSEAHWFSAEQILKYSKEKNEDTEKKREKQQRIDNLKEKGLITDSNKLRIGWAIYEEIGFCAVNDFVALDLEEDKCPFQFFTVKDDYVSPDPSETFPMAVTIWTN